MENISKKDIDIRINNLKNRVLEINSKLNRNNKELDDRYNFAREIGIKVKNINNVNEEIIEELKSYIAKADEILNHVADDEEKEIEECKILNNILYLDDIKLRNINELIQENQELRTKEYINLIADRANQLIREEEIKNIDFNINLLSKRTSLLDKITGKDKMKKVLLENYTLKRVAVINKKYVPENKSILEIVNITKNCGYKSNAIDEFIHRLTFQYELGELVENALVVIDNNQKIPFFFNKEFIQRVNKENSEMLEKINGKKKNIVKTSELEMYNEILEKDISTLELFNFNNVIEEVI